MAQIKLGTNQHEFNSLEKNYKNFSAPAFSIKVNGTNLSKAGMAIQSVTVETTVDSAADSCTFVIVNDFDPIKRDLIWFDKSYFVGNYVEIQMGYVDELKPIFYGIITSVTFDFNSQNKPIVTVKGMDISFLMMRGKGSASWKKVKYSDVVHSIGQKYTSDLQIDSTTDVIDTISKTNQSDFHFLSDLAEYTNHHFFVVGRTLYFRKSLKDKNPVIKLTWGKNLPSLSIDLNLASQLSGVTVSSWDELNEEAFKVEASPPKKLGSNSRTGRDLLKLLRINNVQYEEANTDSRKEAKAYADAIQNESAMQLLTGNGTSIGIPEIRAGRYIVFDGLGKRLSQPFYLTSVTHTIDQSGYTTSFSIGGNAI